MPKRHEEDWPRQVLCCGALEGDVRDEVLKAFASVSATSCLWDCNQII